MIGGLYRRNIFPKYPPKADFTVHGVFNERRYLNVTRVLTWEAAHQDIEQQRQANALFEV